MTAHQPLVSTTIVTRNREEELRKALEAIQNQTYKNIEIVVVDNASEDNSVSMIRKEFPIVKLIKLHRNIGCQPGRNIAMANCNGDIIFNLDDDGTLAQDAVENVINVFNKHPEVGLVAASVRVPEEKEKYFSNFNQDETFFYTSIFIGAAHALKREVLNNAGYFPEYVRGHSEVDLGLRIIDVGWEILYAPNVIMYHAISNIERNLNTHTYYQVRHQLETATRLQPALTAFSQIIWRIFFWFFVSIPKGVFLGYLKGVYHFILTLPSAIRNRKPISVYASRKHHYLKFNKVKELSELPDFSSVGFMESVIWRIKKPK